MEAESGPIPEDLMEEARQLWRGPASRNDVQARATVAAAREAGVEMSIPSVVVAETVRGSARDAKVNRVIKAVGQVTALDEDTGRVAGALLGAAKPS